VILKRQRQEIFLYDRKVCESLNSTEEPFSLFCVPKEGESEERRKREVKERKRKKRVTARYKEREKKRGEERRREEREKENKKRQIETDEERDVFEPTFYLPNHDKGTI